MSRRGYQCFPNEQSAALQDVLTQERVWGFGQVVAVVLLALPFVAFYGNLDSCCNTLEAEKHL
jgi:hypothetical protein